MLELHGCDEVFVSGVIMLVVGADISILVARATTETVRILGEDFADYKPRLVDKDDEAWRLTRAVGLLCGVSLGGASGDGCKFHEMAPSAILSIHAMEEDSCRV
jgi:hypothetical protein